MVTRRSFIVQAIVIAATVIAIVAAENRAENASAQARPAARPQAVVKVTPAPRDSIHRVTRVTLPLEKPKAVSAK